MSEIRVKVIVSEKQLKHALAIYILVFCHENWSISYFLKIGLPRCRVSLYRLIFFEEKKDKIDQII